MISQQPAIHSNNRPVGGASVWPFRLLRSLAFFAIIAGVGYGALDEGSVFGGLYIGAWAGFAVLSMGVVPAIVLFLFDIGLRRRDVYHRPARPQSVARWSAVGGLTGATFGAAYGVVYLNAFAAGAALETTVAYGLAGGAVSGVLVGRLSSIALNLSNRVQPVTTLSGWLRRGAMLWIGSVAAFSYGAHLIDNSFERVTLPAGLLALLGAAVVPQLATTPPVDSRRIPPPELDNAPSPDPDPEGGSGEGARRAETLERSARSGAQLTSGAAAPAKPVEENSIEDRRSPWTTR